MGDKVSHDTHRALEDLILRFFERVIILLSFRGSRSARGIKLEVSGGDAVSSDLERLRSLYTMEERRRSIHKRVFEWKQGGDVDLFGKGMIDN